MAATVRINEFNGPGETPTTGITNSVFGSSDAANLTASSAPITVGTNSFEKWQRIEVTAMGGSSSISDFKVWYTGSLSGSDALKTNARTSSYGGAATYATPTASVSSVATQNMPSSAPATNLGIGGSLAGEITTPASSDYLVMQLQVDGGTTSGASLTMNYRYSEVA